MKKPTPNSLFAVLILILVFGCQPPEQKKGQTASTSKKFKGVIKLDVRESTPIGIPTSAKKHLKVHLTFCSFFMMIPACYLVSIWWPG